MEESCNSSELLIKSKNLLKLFNESENLAPKCKFLIRKTHPWTAYIKKKQD